MPFAPLPTLQLGSRGENVRKLQGYLSLLGIPVTADAIFGNATRQAVLIFQAQAGVRPQDGIVGPLTWAAIENNLGYSVDVGGSAPQVPELPPESPSISPGKVVAGGLVLAGLAGLLFGGRSRK